MLSGSNKTASIVYKLPVFVTTIPSQSSRLLLCRANRLVQSYSDNLKTIQTRAFQDGSGELRRCDVKGRIFLCVLSPSMSWLRQQHQRLRMLSMASWSSWHKAWSRLIRCRQGMTASSMMATPSSTLASAPLQNRRDALSFSACVVDRRQVEDDECSLLRGLYVRCLVFLI